MVPGVDVTITAMEYMHASHAGYLRSAQAVLKGRKDAYGQSAENGFTGHVIGAVAEFVVAKCLQSFWPGPGAIGQPDLSNGVEVRARSGDYGGDPYLVVRRDDRDEAPYVLVVPTPDPLTYTIVGWIHGAEAKRDEWWRELRKGWFVYAVPAANLRHIFDLKELLQACSAPQ